MVTYTDFYNDEFYNNDFLQWPILLTIFTIRKKYNVVKTLVAKKKYNAAIFAKGSRKKIITP